MGAEGLELIGIAFVIDDVSKGFKLAFRYPAPPCNLASNDEKHFHDLEAGLFAKLFRPRSMLCNQTFELIIDRLRFVSHPVLVQASGSETTMFNVVFALNEDVPMTALRAIGAQLSNGLLHEELRMGFVSQQVKTLLQIEEEELTGNPAAHRQTFIDVALERSALANNLKDIYHGIKEGGTVHVLINEWIKISLTTETHAPISPSDLRPYQTLLLMRDEERILDSLPCDSSPELVTCIRMANPLKSFQELHLDMGVSLEQLYRLAAHLAYWGVARIITTITQYGIYQVHPEANIQPSSTLALEFRRKFAPNELHQVLSTFSATRRLGEYLKKINGLAQNEFLHIVVSLVYNCVLIIIMMNPLQ